MHFDIAVSSTTYQWGVSLFLLGGTVEIKTFLAAIVLQCAPVWFLEICKLPDIFLVFFCLIFALCLNASCYIDFNAYLVDSYAFICTSKGPSLLPCQAFPLISIASDSFSLKVFHSALFFFISSSISFFLLKLSHSTSVARVSNTRSVAKGLSLDITRTLIWTPLVRTL